MAKSRKGKDADQIHVDVLLAEFWKSHSEKESTPSASEKLADVLNGDTLGSEAKSRVEWIIRLLQGQKDYQSLIAEHRHAQGENTVAEAYMLTLIDMSRQLNELLSRYHVIPQTHPAWPVPLHFFVPADSSHDSESSRAEIGAVMSAVLLSQRDEYGVRKCSCGKFFAVGRIDQKHCSINCRVKAHQSSDEFKTKRRAADRERYRLHRDGKVKEATKRRKNVPKKTR